MFISEETYQLAEETIDNLPLEKLWKMEQVIEPMEDEEYTKEDMKNLLHEDIDYVLPFMKQLKIPIKVVEHDCSNCHAKDVTMIADKPRYRFKCPQCQHIEYEI